MTMDSPISRRTALAAGVAGAGAVALAACSSSQSDSGSSNDQKASQQPAGPASTGSGAGSRGSSGSGAALIKLADVPVGQAKAVKLPDGKPAVVARPNASTAVCFSAICTHQGCTVAVNGNKLNCPCHGSQFNALTGAVLSGLASKPLPKVAVKVENGQVVTAGGKSGS
jgi:cytochrome b6-f complex iron-sulfur subunit